jgi:hypothetical protein
MAAVFALVFLFVLASVGALFKVVAHDLSWTTGVALATFAVLAFGVFGGLFKMTRRWEGEADRPH